MLNPMPPENRLDVPGPTDVTQSRPQGRSRPIEALRLLPNSACRVILGRGVAWLPHIPRLGLRRREALSSALQDEIGTPGYRLRNRRELVALIAVALAFVAYSLVTIARTTFVYEGTRYFTLFDDEMIGMRYARNLVRGDGLVFNPREKVEGITNPLWVGLMALLHLLPISEALISLPVQLMGMLLLGLTGFFTYRIAREVSGDDFAVGLASAVFTLFHYPLLNWSLQGLEVSLIAFLAVWSVWSVLRMEGSGRFSSLPYVLLSVGMLARMDVAVIYAALLAYCVVTDRVNRKRHLTIGVSLLLLSLAAQTVARYLYYGDLLPNTYYLKVGGVPIFVRIARGARVLLASFISLNVAALFVVATICVSRKRKLVFLLIPLLAQAAYSVWVGGDAWEWWGHSGGANRYLSVAMPMFFIVLGYAAKELMSPVFRWSRLKKAAWFGSVAYGVLCLGLLLLTNLSLLEFWVLSRPVPDTEELKWHAKLGLTLKKHTTPSARVAVVWAGALPYFSDRYCVDMLGKCERRIAQLPPRLDMPWGFWPGHAKWDYAGTLNFYKPDLVVELWAKPEEAKQVLEADYHRVEWDGLSVFVRNGTRNVRQLP